MAISTYAELQTAIADWLNRDDLTSVIPTFITLTEAALNRQLRVNEMIERDTSTISGGYVNMPVDWLETISLITIGSPPVVLEYVAQMGMAEVRATQRAGDPIVYTIINNKFQIFPAPSASTDVEMTYYAKIPALSDSNTSNWLLANHPDAYLFGSLVHAEPYLKNDERMPMWASMYKGSIDAIGYASERAKRPEGGLHSRKRTFG
jgi:hypothetical protein